MVSEYIHELRSKKSTIKDIFEYNTTSIPTKIIASLLSIIDFDTVWNHRALCSCNLVLHKLSRGI